MIQGEYVPNTLFGLKRVWNRYGTDTQLNITFQVLHSMVWNGGVWNGIRGLDPELWIGVWIGMCARPCSGPFILSGSHMYIDVFCLGGGVKHKKHESAANLGRACACNGNHGSNTNSNTSTKSSEVVIILIQAID